jgi:hypothetical protein
MTLFLQNDAGGSGTGGVFADRGFGHLVQIANMDTGIGQDAPVGDLIRITYTETLTGITPDRLDDLVNTDFSGVPGTTDIIVIPVDATFVRPNGHFVTENAGLTFPVGNAENPTSSVLIVYDTSDNNGGGYCLPAEGGGTVGFPGLVILYHELSHALRMATSSQLDNSDTGCTANPEEHQAEIDENDMRDQLGVGHRDTTQHCATTGCTSSCCVVASVATGSPYSADVNQLTDRHADTSSDASTFVLPEFTAVDPHGTTTLELRLPRVLTRIAGANDQGAPVIERFRIDEADDVEVEVGWSDTPFYRDPRPKLAEDAHPVAQLRTWERGLATARAPLAKGPSAG